MDNSIKPRLVFFQWRHKRAPEFIKLHMQLHVKCLSEFFEVIVINEDCDYQQICEQYQPDITLFESGVKYIAERINIKNTNTYLQIPKLGFHNGDSWCDCRAGFLSDMQHWGIKTFFSICTTMAEHTPEITDNLFVWPNFIDADIYRDYHQTKIIPILLTGSTFYLYPWRQRIYKIISQHYPSLICPHAGYDKRSTSRMIYGEQYARTINASWCVPTCGAVAKEIVRKHFEIPASKSCLITEKTSALEAAGFVDMENCVFVDEHNVLDKLDYLFQNLDELESITNAGYQLVHSRHTLKQRDQIFQWFNLSKNLKQNQKIIQKSPFEPLIVVKKSSEIKNSHITCNGITVELLHQGDEKLWAGKYEDAEALYLRCVNYTICMPEPKLKLALCRLYKGDAAGALSWIIQPIEYTLEEYKALDPDPVEWAYFIISLMCQGKLNEAINRANQFLSMSHPELDRTRWAVNILKNTVDETTLSYSEGSIYRYSLHLLPKRSLNDWVDNLCTMLKACQQASLADKLSKSFYTAKEFKELEYTPISSFENKTNILKAKDTLYPNYIIKLRQFGYFKLIVPCGKLLQSLETKFGFFLPYHLSSMQKDEFFHEIQKLVSEEYIKTVLVIGASAGEGSTEACLAGIRKNPSKPTVFCINISTPRFIKLLTRYANDFYIKCYNISSVSQKTSTDSLNNSILKIKQDNQINCFDMLIIDSCKLNYSFELDSDDKAKFVVLNDISILNNYKNHHKLIVDPNYKLVAQNPSLRNGYAIFKKFNYEETFSCTTSFCDNYS